ncbi:MAG TPA: DUF5335 family protein [Vicinamibacterales bacterium]|jgi:hypothetical protein|nr:DUF5335 family protein [Vicinamibacterales bacterium]
MRTIPRHEWTSYFEQLSATLTGTRVEVEATSLDLGDQIVAEWLPLLGITYDAKDDLLDVALGGEDHLTHLIRHPVRIDVTEEAHEVRGLAVSTPDGVQVLRFKDPLRLAAPQS